MEQVLFTEWLWLEGLPVAVLLVLQVALLGQHQTHQLLLFQQ
jgi:hypothetical protein